MVAMSVSASGFTRQTALARLCAFGLLALFARAGVSGAAA